MKSKSSDFKIDTNEDRDRNKEINSEKKNLINVLNLNLNKNIPFNIKKLFKDEIILTRASQLWEKNFNIKKLTRKESSSTSKNIKKFIGLSN